MMDSLGILNAIMARLVEGGLFVIVLVIFFITSWCLFFKKMGNQRYEALISGHNLFVLITNAGKPGRWVFAPILLIILPFIEWTLGEIGSWIVGIILGVLFLLIRISINFGLTKKFGKGTWFSVGLILLPFVFYPILAWGKSKYKK